MNVEKYKTFLACAGARTFFDAAEILYSTPSTVSKHIASLEKEFGCTLFLRTPKGLVLTAAGAKRLPAVRRIVEAEDKLAALSETQGDPLVIPVYPLSRRLGLEALFHAFEARYPALPLSVSETVELYRRLKAGEIPFAFFYMADALPEEMEAISFPVGRMGVAVPEDHPFAALPAISLSALDGEKLLVLDGPAIRKAAFSRFGQAGVAPYIEYVLDREDAILFQIAKTGVPGLYSSDTFALFSSPGLVFVPFREEWESTGQMVRMRGVPFEKKALVFWKFAEEWLLSQRKGSRITKCGPGKE